MALEKEKQDKLDRKERQREAAMRVTKENEIEKQKRLAEKEADRQHTLKVQEEYNRMLDA